MTVANEMPGWSKIIRWRAEGSDKRLGPLLHRRELVGKNTVLLKNVGLEVRFRISVEESRSLICADVLTPR